MADPHRSRRRYPYEPVMVTCDALVQQIDQLSVDLTAATVQDVETCLALADLRAALLRALAAARSVRR